VAAACLSAGLEQPPHLHPRRFAPDSRFRMRVVSGIVARSRASSPPEQRDARVSIPVTGSDEASCRKFCATARSSTRRHGRRRAWRSMRTNASFGRPRE
jgi:hypothetical protein